jgi:Ni,Fe-hydrogenase maturation factor
MKIIAMGNELRKDDSIALDIAKEIGAIKVYSCPENFVKENEEVIIVDAVDFGKEPGNVKSFKPMRLRNTA